ncbi:MAG TPA: flagellar motor protein MotB [Pirellulaceae bacterium]|nr:flagellar motor protein MotB [Pirellulaceae bacterium]
MAVEEEVPIGIPEWVVTFGDMMSLLLTFFIMLVSLSEMKEEEKYQALVESMQEQFGHVSSQVSLIPGDLRPRNSRLAKTATMGRAKRLDTMRGGDKVQAPTGDHTRVVIVRPGTKTGIGTVIYFEEGIAELTDEHRAVLSQQGAVMQGKSQKIDVRGHTSHKPVAADRGLRDNWDLAYQRSRNVMQYLIQDLNIDARRIRMSVAGPYEPAHIGTDENKLRQNPRVEVYMLDEVISDTVGTQEEQQERFTPIPESP